MSAKIKEFLKEYESKIALIVGFILVAVLSFQAGIIRGKGFQEKPMVIEKTVPIQSDPGTFNGASTYTENAHIDNSEQKNVQDSINCAFVGSKNSNKYHLPTCRWAKNIKPENIVCFKDENEAKSKGYAADKTCIKY